MWWNNVKKLAGLSSSKFINTLTYNDTSFSGTALANLFNEKFVSVGSSLPPLEWTPIPVTEVPPEFSISVEDVQSSLSFCKVHSSCGPDNILSWLLRENSSSLSHPLCAIFNASIHEGNVPSVWKSVVVSLPKTDLAVDVDSDFRPISLTPVVSRLLEKFPFDWLLNSIYDQIDPL